jgi:ActR/RegA family two-component response regulator
LRDWGATVFWVRTLDQGLRACNRPFELMVLDVDLPDGSGVALAELAARMRPQPIIISISGQATPRDAFRLAQLGALALLTKPLSLADFMVTVEAVLEKAPDYVPHLVAVVGHESFRTVLDRVRRAMAEQALALAEGNKTGAARLLGITRQAVQQLIRDLDLHDGQRHEAKDEGAFDPASRVVPALTQVQRDTPPPAAVSSDRVSPALGRRRLVRGRDRVSPVPGRDRISPPPSRDRISPVPNGEH